MNKEVKSALLDLQSAVDAKRSALSFEYTISTKSIETILDYIKYLEKRNKELCDGFRATTQELCEYAEKNEELETIISDYVNIVLHDRKEIDRLNGIIKKVREYINARTFIAQKIDTLNYETDNLIKKELLEILDKEDKR